MEKYLMTRTEFAALAGITQGGVTRAAKTSLLAATDGKFIDANHEAARIFLEKCPAHKTEILPGIDDLYEAALTACQESGRWSVNFLRRQFSIGETRAKKIMTQLQAAGSWNTAKSKTHAAKVSATKREDKVLAGISGARTPPKPVTGTAARREKQIASDAGDLQEIDLPENVVAYADLTVREVCFKFGNAPRFADYMKAMKEIGMMAEREIRLAEIKGTLVSRKLVQERVVEQFDEAHMKLLRDGSKTIAVQVSAMAKAGEPIEEIEKFVAEKISDFIRPAKAKITKALRHD